MKEKDLKKDSYYRFIFDNSTYIVKTERDNYLSVYGHIEIEDKEYIGNDYFAEPNSIEPATNKERIHLNACLKADKYIPIEEVVFNEKVEMDFDIF